MRRFMLVTVSVLAILLISLIDLVTTGKIMTMEELNNVQGRAWDDVDVSTGFVGRQD